MTKLESISVKKRRRRRCRPGRNRGKVVCGNPTEYTLRVYESFGLIERKEDLYGVSISSDPFMLIRRLP